jgi:hypothetical protein
METEKQYVGPYKVVKIFRVSKRHEIIESYLTREQAQRLVQSFPDSKRSMVVFYKQFDSPKYYV